jgi:hypothetical protein
VYDGAVMSMELVHEGAVFDVYRAGDVALKVPKDATRTGISGVSASTSHNGSTLFLPWETHFGARAALDVDPLELLRSEHARICAAGDTWNHESLGLRELEGKVGLATRWIDGEPLSRKPLAAQRGLWPAMLPALWDSLAAAPHGDVDPANLLLLADGQRFALIDPAPMVVVTKDQGASRRVSLAFTTRAGAYPILPPYWDARVEAGMTRPSCVEALLRVLIDEGDAAPGETPFVADWLAVGIQYYRMLGGRWPFGDEAEPAWAGMRADVFRSSGAEPLMLLALSTVPPPSIFAEEAADVRPAEDALALALVNLTISSREQLVGVVREVLVGR